MIVSSSRLVFSRFQAAHNENNVFHLAIQLGASIEITPEMLELFFQTSVGQVAFERLFCSLFVQKVQTGRFSNRHVERQMYNLGRRALLLLANLLNYLPHHFGQPLNAAKILAREVAWSTF
jgi:hypothetical protein